MELDEFITKTITGIIKGVNDSMEFAKTQNAVVNPLYQNVVTGVHASKTNIIEFDIAVTISNEQSSGIKGGIKILAFASLNGNTSDKGINETISRIKFTVPIVLETK